MSKAILPFLIHEKFEIYPFALDFVYAFKPEVGFDYIETHESDSIQEKGKQKVPQVNNGPFELRLSPFTEIKILVTDEQNRPIPNAIVFPSSFQKEGSAFRFGTIGTPAFFRNVRTGNDGIALLKNVPETMKESTRFAAMGYNEPLTPAGAKEEHYYGSQEYLWTDFDLSQGQLPKIPMSIIAETRGRVLREDGTPVAHVPISINRHKGCGHGIILTDAEGNFRLKGPTETSWNLAVESMFGAAPAIFEWNMGNGQKAKTLDIVLKKGIKLHGIITLPDGKPLPDHTIVSAFIQEKEMPPIQNQEKQPPVCDKEGCDSIEPLSMRQFWSLYDFSKEKGQPAGYYQYILPAAPRRYDMSVYAETNPGAIFERNNIIVQGDEKEIRLDIKLEPFQENPPR